MFVWEGFLTFGAYVSPRNVCLFVGIYVLGLLGQPQQDTIDGAA